MKKGLFITLLGAIVAALGLALFPFFNLEELFQTPKAVDFMQGQVLLAFPVLALLTSILIYSLRLRREYALLNVLYGGFGIAFQTYIFFGSLSLFSTVVVIAEVGYFVTMLGCAFMILGAMMSLVSNPQWDPEQRSLRVALLFKDSVIAEKILLEPEDITIGESVSNTFTVPAPNIPDRFKIFKSTRTGKYTIGLIKKLTGMVRIGDIKSSVTEYIGKHTSDVGGTNYVDIGGTDWGVITFGDINLFFQFISQREKVGAKKGFVFDWHLVGTIMLSAVFQFSLIFASIFTWKEEPLKKKVNVLLESLNVDVKKEKLEDPEMLEEEGMDEDTAGKKAEGDEGKFGDPDIDPDLESKVPKRDGKLVKEIDPKKVGLNDILGNSKIGGAGALSSIMGDSSGFSNKIAIAMNGTGAEFVMGHGSGGLSFKGTGKGGGGLGGYGRIYGVANVDTGGGQGLHANLGKKGKKKVGRIKLSGGTSSGFCEKSNIKKVVMRRRNAIKFCYDKALMLNPKLSGKVVVTWTIGGNGRVIKASISQATLKDKSVHSCMLMRVKSMRFAKPKSGQCIVRWPFIFNPGS